MKITVLDAGTLGADLDLSKLSSVGEAEIYDATSPSEVSERIKNSDVVIINKVKMNESVLSGAERLKLICVAATARGEGRALREDCWGEARPAGPSLRSCRVPGAGCLVNTVFMSGRDTWCLPHLMSTWLAFSPKAKLLEDQGRRLLFPSYLLGR